MKILHVDDTTDITEPISMFLHANGYEYESITDGRKAVELIETNRYDLVLLDIHMPEFSGYDVIDLLTKNSSMRNQKVIVLTAGTVSEKQRSYFNQFGVCAILDKPIVDEELLRKIKEIELQLTVS